MLSKIISEINDQYGVIFNEQEKKDLNQMKENIFSNTEIKRYMKGNSSDQNKFDYFISACENIRINTFKENFDLFKKMDSEPQIKKKILEGFFNEYKNY